MQATEREFLLDYLRSNQDRLHALTAKLTPAKLNFRTEGHWSVADCVEHITLVERQVFAMIVAALETAATPEQVALAQGKDKLILEGVPSRERKVVAPEHLLPTGRWPDFAENLRQFGAARAASIHLAETTELDLRAYVSRHFVIKEMDCYQWMLFLGSHAERHLRQVEEVMADAEFPR